MSIRSSEAGQRHTDEHAQAIFLSGSERLRDSIPCALVDMSEFRKVGTLQNAGIGPTDVIIAYLFAVTIIVVLVCCVMCGKRATGLIC